ncbi:hypothetical protein EYF80_062560 [Liparis tanakae]
MCRQS